MNRVFTHMDWRAGRAAMLRAAGLLLCLGSAFAFIPLAPSFPEATLDSGWAFAINVAMAKGLVLGRDVVFTFGPYADLYSTQYSPATDMRILAGGSLLAAAFATGLLCLARGGAMLASLGFALYPPLAGHDAQLFALPLVMLLLSFRCVLPLGHRGHIGRDAQVKLALALLALALALLPLIKGTLVIASGLAMLLGSATLFLGGAPLLAGAGACIYGAVVALPAAPGRVWAEVTLKPNLAGKLLTPLYKPPALMIGYTLADGQSLGYRYFAGGGETGFLIAPVVRNTQDFGEVISGLPGSAPYPRSFYIPPSGHYWTYRAWQRDYRLRLFTLQMSPG